jgi:hypothetical protein
MHNKANELTRTKRYTLQTTKMAAIQRPTIVPPVAPPVFIVYDGMVACGINNKALFDGDTAATRIAANLFGDDFSTCMDKGMEELDAEFKSYSDLTMNQGQIRVLPGTKRTIRAIIQWVRDGRRLGRDPVLKYNT